MADAPSYPLITPLQNSVDPFDAEPHPDDLNRLKKWQEERLERKLRGDYESAVMHLSDVVSRNLQTPVGISSVRIEGAAHTRRSFLSFLIDPALESAAETRTLESVLQTTRKISQTLNRTDIFSTVEAKIERARDDLAREGDVDLVFRTREKGRFYMKTSTELGNNEGTASATGRVRNMFGGGETFEANMALGTKTRRAFHASLNVPLSADLLSHGEIIASGMESDHTTYASCMENLRGLKASLRRGGHEFTYQAMLRHVGGLTPTASMSIREAAGQSTKSSISHTYVRDTRDDRITATRGVYTKIFQEYAGLGGEARFYKAEGEVQASRPVLHGISASLSARSGVLLGVSQKTAFSDRFQLGGPTSVRSFRMNSMGPRDGSDSIGGDIYYSAGASIISNIPSKAHWPVKAHLWANAGRLDNIDRSKSLMVNVKEALTHPSVSVGLGLVYRFDPIRIEVNFGLPIAASKSDGYRKGVQVGMGLEFL